MLQQELTLSSVLIFINNVDLYSLQDTDIQQFVRSSWVLVKTQNVTSHGVVIGRIVTIGLQTPMGSDPHPWWHVIIWNHPFPNKTDGERSNFVEWNAWHEIWNQTSWRKLCEWFQGFGKILVTMMQLMTTLCSVDVNDSDEEPNKRSKPSDKKVKAKKNLTRSSKMICWSHCPWEN